MEVGDLTGTSAEGVIQAARADIAYQNVSVRVREATNPQAPTQKTPAKLESRRPDSNRGPLHYE